MELMQTFLFMLFLLPTATREYLGQDSPVALPYTLPKQLVEKKNRHITTEN